MQDIHKFVPFVERNQHKIDWIGLSCNLNAISLIENNLNKIDWC
jgi:hypothetical protein